MASLSNLNELALGVLTAFYKCFKPLL